MPTVHFIEKLFELGRQLEVLDPVIESFARSHGYRNLLAVERGRRPLREVRKDGDVSLGIGFELISDSNGDYCEQLSADAPFRFWWGKFTERDSVQISINWAFTGPIPFSNLKSNLLRHLDLANVTMSEVTLDELLRDGFRIDRKAKFTLEDAERYSAQIRFIKA